MTWPTNPRPAKSIAALRAEVDARFPHRSKASDGMLGDADHATRDSDHNPWVRDGKVGVVTAVDITEDSAPGVPEIADLIVATLIEGRDARVKYLIHEGLIWRSYDKVLGSRLINAWQPAPYAGPNGHFHHCHVSVWDSKALYDSTAPWGIWPAPKETVAMTRGPHPDAALEHLLAARREVRKAMANAEKNSKAAKLRKLSAANVDATAAIQSIKSIKPKPKKR